MRRIIRNIFLKNWGLKLFSLILALILWLTLIPEEKILSEKTLAIALEPHNIPAEMELVEKHTEPIEVTIRAPKGFINKITKDNVVAKLNLENATTEQTEFPLTNAMISLPSKAKVIRVKPNKVRLTLEKIKEVMLDIEPNIIGKLKEGLKIAKIEVFPPRVIVKGAESKIKEKDKVRTSPVDISSLTQSAEFEADLILPNPDFRLDSSKTKVKVKITIQKEETKEDKDIKKKQNGKTLRN